MIYLNTDGLTSGALRPGDRLLFGRYPKDSDTPEPIEWRVLAAENGRALMLSEYVLDAHIYDVKSSVWKTSELRGWLNIVFSGKAFSAAEQMMIPVVNGDKVTLLDQIEAEKYLGSLREPTPEGYRSYPGRTAEFTPYAMSRAILGTGEGWWWLRSHREQDVCTEFVDINGIIYHSAPGVIRDRGGVRPVISLIL